MRRNSAYQRWTAEENAAFEKARRLKFSSAEIVAFFNGTRTRYAILKRASDEVANLGAKKQRNPTTPRKCMCCSVVFQSEGKHHRLCQTCRHR